VAELILPDGGEPAGAAGRDDWRAGIRDLVAALARVGVTVTCTRADGPRYGALDLDSNLPDVRIVVGGPGLSSWTAGLLATLDTDTAAGITAQLSGPVGSRVWVPAARPRAGVFTAGADVRAPRDLPALIVSGDEVLAAVAALTADLDDAVIEAGLAATGTAGDQPGSADGEPHDRLLASHSVALLNRGTPSSLVTPDGTLHIALMRACSAWPCGVWIDGPRRTVPDDSSFAWQHWSHTFCYALAAGAGDWRDAGFAAAGHEYNHELLAVETGLHDGALPATGSLGGVTTRGGGHPAALLSALKPRGNPLAGGRPGQPQRDAGVTIRLRDCRGLPAAAGWAEVRLRGGITAVRLTSLTEGDDGPTLDVTAGSALVPVPPAGLVTLAAIAAAEPAGHGTADPALGAEPVQPVFTRYWLHGKGPAPAGNLPVSVHLSPDRIPLDGPGTAAAPGAASAGSLCLTVACGPVPATGVVTLDVPPGLAVTCPDGTPYGPLRYALPGRDYARWDLSVRALPGTGPGRYFLAARIGDDLGQVLEDAALITVGEQPGPAPVQPRAELLAALEASRQAQAAEIGVDLAPATLELAPGEDAALTVRLANRTASVIRGESQLMSPWGSWPAAQPWTRAFTAGPGETVHLDYAVTLPASARPGSHWWALAKVMYFGRVQYTECAQIRVTGSPG
jgi:hypothetical protein